MDISFLQEELDKGMQIRDLDGKVTDPFCLIKKYGVNSVRLQIWKNPEMVSESGGYYSRERTIAHL